MIQSRGSLVLSDTTPVWARTGYPTPFGLDLTGHFSTYSAIYRRQPWVFILVRKLGRATARVPLKTYKRGPGGRDDASDTPYGQLMLRPNPRHNPKFLWLWTSSTKDVYGEAIWLKIRDRNGVPVELWPVHPANLQPRLQNDELTYVFYGAAGNSNPVFEIPERDVLHFKDYNPDNTVRGLSPLEPLRSTLQSEDAARRADAAFWNNGARPAVVLSHPKTLSDPARQRLRDNWDEVHGGVDNFSKTAVLEEGLTATPLIVNNRDAEYIQGRKLNREEACAVYDVPPPAVHILDHATFSNITEQLRSMYRDTMAPRFVEFEAVMHHDLQPDFGDDHVYNEFYMDDVLRGDWEARMEANAKAVQFAIATPAEVRERENLPLVDGSDQLFVNSTMIPLALAGANVSARPQVTHNSLTAAELRTITDRASRRDSLEQLDARQLVAGLNGKSGAVLVQLEASKAAGHDVAGFLEHLWAAARRNESEGS